MRRLKILTWHVHGSYLYYLTQAPHEFYLPSKPDRPSGYVGKWGHIPWGENVHDVPLDHVKDLEVDCILFQHRDHYLNDQYQILSEAQRRLPRIYLEHEPPMQSPTDSRHCVDDPEMLLVHVTPYNDLVWNSGRTPTRIIEHGVLDPGVRYEGSLDRGLVMINHLGRRGRSLGIDIFQQARAEVPLDLIGMAAEEAGGLGEVLHAQIPEFSSKYRFLFHPVRYCSMALAVCEAMMVGLPIVALATTEIATVIENSVSGYVDTRVSFLMERMKELCSHPREARRLGEGAYQAARERYNIDRFVRDWNAALFEVTGLPVTELEAVR
jgi:glycosyltransferase involved in cell wall biosynthesis